MDNVVIFADAISFVEQIRDRRKYLWANVFQDFMSDLTLLRAFITSSLALLCLAATPPRAAIAQTGRASSDKLLQAEQSILSSLSARAVSFTQPKSSARASAPEIKNISLQKNNESTTSVGDSPAAAAPAPATEKTVGTTFGTTPPREPVAVTSPPVKQVAAKQISVESKALSAGRPDQEKPSSKEAPAKPAPLESASQLRTTNALLRSQLEQRDLQVAALTKQVQELQSQLTMAEVEVERLSAVMDAKTRASLGQYKTLSPSPSRATNNSAEERAHLAQGASQTQYPARDVQPPTPDTNLEVATIAVSKADLRLGPGNNHSALLSLPRGSRLAVETRQGEWLRVFAPSGERAWIHASLVRFGDTSSSASGERSAVAVKGFSSSVEDEAFRRFQHGNGAH